MDGNERPYHALSVIPDINERILEGIGAGKSLTTIAEEYGVSDTAILNRAVKSPEYKARASIGIRLRMERRERELEAADTNVGVTRADRLLGHARWVAERSVPEEWGQHTNISISVSYADALREISERKLQEKVIEGKVLSITDAAQQSDDSEK